MELDIYIIDAFTNTQFKGNSAAVVPVKEWLPETLMQSIAAENNLSETAFIKEIEANIFEIRWFSPMTEIDFCGHATLASSYVLYEYLGIEGCITFQTLKVGNLVVKKNVDNRIEMSFPNLAPEVISSVPSQLIDGLSIKPEEILRNQQAYVVVYQNEKDVLSVERNNKLLEQLVPYDVVVTAPSQQYDFVSRYFWPANGGDEDPVTGSIHADLVPYWSEKLGKKELVAYQASARSGVLYCQLNSGSVMVSGDAMLYLKGKIYV